MNFAFNETVSKFTSPEIEPPSSEVPASMTTTPSETSSPVKIPALPTPEIITVADFKISSLFSVSDTTVVVL